MSAFDNSVWPAEKQELADSSGHREVLEIFATMEPRDDFILLASEGFLTHKCELGGAEGFFVACVLKGREERA